VYVKKLVLQEYHTQFEFQSTETQNFKILHYLFYN